MVFPIVLFITIITGFTTWYFNTKETLEWKNKGIKRVENGENFTRSYTDSKGRRRDIETDIPVEFKIDKKTGHYIVYARPNDRSGKLYYLRDATAIEAAYRINEAIKKYNGKSNTVAPINLPRLEEYIGRADGYKYIDLKTKEIYVIRGIQPKGIPDYTFNPRIHKATLFYMNVHTGELIRRTDGQIIRDKNYPQGNCIPIEETDKFIIKFNNIQKERRRKYINNKLDYKHRVLFNVGINTNNYCIEKPKGTAYGLNDDWEIKFQKNLPEKIERNEWGSL